MLARYGKIAWSQRRWVSTKATMFGLLTICCILATISSSYSQRGSDYLFISNERSGTISVISTSSEQVVDTIPVAGQPRGIRSNPDGSLIYVALSSSSTSSPGVPSLPQIIVVDSATRQILRSFALDWDPIDVTTTSDDNTLYVIHDGVGRVSIVDSRSGAIARTLDVGLQPSCVVRSPDGRWIYVANSGSGTISVIDTTVQEVVSTFAVGIRPHCVVFVQDSSAAYVTDPSGGSVIKVRVPQHTIEESIPLAPGTTPLGITASSLGTRLYVTNPANNSMFRVWTADNAVTGSVQVGSYPSDIALSPYGRTVYTVNNQSNTVSVIDARTFQVRTTISVGDGPVRVATDY